ncbi:MAG: hypothetical protein WHU54_01805 [Candidatus Bathyarchaeia archaeon]
MDNSEIGKFTLKNFTTKPKFLRFLKRGAFISLNRASEFMTHLWEVGLKKCSYETLEWEFIQFFGSNDKRTIERYIGRPEKTERHMGLSKIVRMNRVSGKVAQFEYMNERRLSAKKGLLEILGYISKDKEGKETHYIIHHELMPYYTEQTVLQETYELQETANPQQEPYETQEGVNLQQEFNESCEVSKEVLRVCSLYEEENKKIQQFLQGKEREKTVSEVVSPPSIEAKERIKEEVIDSTHTNQSSVKVNVIEEAERILSAKPIPKRCLDCGRVNAANPYSVLCPKGLGMRSRSDFCVLEGGH